jgi:hypothetical protein
MQTAAAKAAALVRLAFSGRTFERFNKYPHCRHAAQAAQSRMRQKKNVGVCDVHVLLSIHIWL